MDELKHFIKFCSVGRTPPPHLTGILAIIDEFSTDSLHFNLSFFWVVGRSDNKRFVTKKDSPSPVE